MFLTSKTKQTTGGKEQMAKNENSVKLEGNICKDPRFHVFPSGGMKATFRLAVSGTYKNKSGAEVKNPMFIDVVQSLKKGEEALAEAMLVKGAPVRVEGRLNQRSYAIDGAQRTIVEVFAFKVEKRVFAKRDATESQAA